MSSIQIKTDIHGAMIVQENTGPAIEIDNVREIYARRVMDTQEMQVREALIRMGWTPPPEEPHKEPPEAPLKPYIWGFDPGGAEWYSSFKIKG